MVRPVVDQVAALTQALQIARPIVARIVVEVCGGQDDAGPSYPCGLSDIGPGGGLALVIAPRMTGSVEPAAVRQAANGFAMWPAAPCEAASGMAFDVETHRLFLGCDNHLMLMLDSNTGKVVGSVPIGAGVDANAFDISTPRSGW